MLGGRLAVIGESQHFRGQLTDPLQQVRQIPRPSSRNRPLSTAPLPRAQLTITFASQPGPADDPRLPLLPVDIPHGHGAGRCSGDNLLTRRHRLQPPGEEDRVCRRCAVGRRRAYAVRGGVWCWPGRGRPHFPFFPCFGGIFSLNWNQRRGAYGSGRTEGRRKRKGQSGTDTVNVDGELLMSHAGISRSFGQ